MRKTLVLSTDEENRVLIFNPDDCKAVETVTRRANAVMHHDGHVVYEGYVYEYDFNPKFGRESKEKYRKLRRLAKGFEPDYDSRYEEVKEFPWTRKCKVRE